VIDPGALALRIPSLTITTALLPDGVKAYYYPDIDTIVLDEQLSNAEKRCALMHELVHRAVQDDGDLPSHFDLVQERRCRTLTAQALIDIFDLGDALQWSDDLHEIAEHLVVDLDTLNDRLDPRNLTPDEAGYLRLVRARREGAA
jgi:Zn-dependent peptidase ImmA (M78 family)